MQPRAKSPCWSGFLSLLLPGLGQIYCHQDNKGVFLIGMCLFGQWSTSGMSSWVLWPVMAVDAWMIAQKIQSGAAVQRWEFFPGFRPLNSIPPRIILLSIVVLIATLTVINVLHFVSGYSLTAQ